jgi:L-asparaginase
MPRIVVFTLGGTIAMTSTDGGPVQPSLGGAALIDGIPGLDRAGVEVEAVPFRQIPAGTLSPADLLALTRAAAAAIARGANGVVVTQGTDTIEETAFLLDLAWPGNAPLVVTGAMRNPSQAGPDGPANVLAAIQTAAAPQARGRGCLVVFAEAIHSARAVAKSHTVSVTAFTSPGSGPVGYVVEGVPVFTAPAPARVQMPSVPVDSGVRVGLALATLGDDGRWLPAYAEGLDGLVVAGFGVGHVHRAWVEPLTELAVGMPVVLASRILAGPSLTHTYGFPGSESDLLGRGLISAGRLTAVKARILLWMLLAGRVPAPALGAFFLGM